LADEVSGQLDATKVPRYAGIATFARLPRIDDVSRYDVAILGVPFDSGVTYRPGARFGPAAIREASRLLRPYNPAMGVRPFDDQQVVDAGDMPATPFDIPQALASIEQRLVEILADEAKFAVLGGDHTIALPALRALHRKHGPVALVHFDAHLDTWDTYFEAPYTHGTPFRRAFEEGLLEKDRCVHVGTRGSLYAPTDLEDDNGMGFDVITADEVGHAGVRAVVSRIHALLGDRPTYISLDIDVLDPAHAPGTGTPEAGGISARELLGMLRGLSGLRLVGCDVVEVAPAYDHAEITAVAAANAVYELLSIMALGGIGTGGGAERERDG
jgi:agmatinase